VDLHLIARAAGIRRATSGMLRAVTDRCVRPRRAGGMGGPVSSAAGTSQQAEVVGQNAGPTLFPFNFLFFISFYNSRNSYKLLKYIEK
jgi:hypothetical protein